MTGDTSQYWLTTPPRSQTQCAGTFTEPSNLKIVSGKQVHHWAHSIDAGTEPQRGCLIGPKSHSRKEAGSN